MGIRKILQKQILLKKFFFQSEHVSNQVWCQKFFPLLGGGPSEIFFPSLNMYQAKSGVKKFSLYWRGGPSENFFFQSEHVSSQIWCQKFLPLRGGVGGVPLKIFFPSLNMYQAKSGVKNFSLYWGGCLKIYFFQSEHVSSQIWCQKFFPLLGEGGVPLKKFFSQSEHVSSQTAWLKISHFTPCVYLAYLKSYGHLKIVKCIGMY